MKRMCSAQPLSLPLCRMAILHCGWHSQQKIKIMAYCILLYDIRMNGINGALSSLLKLTPSAIRRNEKFRKFCAVYALLFCECAHSFRSKTTCNNCRFMVEIEYPSEIIRTRAQHLLRFVRERIGHVEGTYLQMQMSSAKGYERVVNVGVRRCVQQKRTQTQTPFRPICTQSIHNMCICKAYVSLPFIAKYEANSCCEDNMQLGKLSMKRWAEIVLHFAKLNSLLHFRVSIEWLHSCISLLLRTNRRNVSIETLDRFTFGYHYYCHLLSQLKRSKSIIEYFIQRHFISLFLSVQIFSFSAAT